MPMKTRIISVRSRNVRGRSAEMIPTGIEISRKSSVPPTSSDAVTGIADTSVSVTGVFVWIDVPSDWCRVAFHTYSAHCIGNGALWSPIAWEMVTWVVSCPRPAGTWFGGMTKKRMNEAHVMIRMRNTPQTSRRSAYAITAQRERAKPLDRGSRVLAEVVPASQFYEAALQPDLDARAWLASADGREMTRALDRGE